MFFWPTPHHHHTIPHFCSFITLYYHYLLICCIIWSFTCSSKLKIQVFGFTTVPHPFHSISRQSFPFFNFKPYHDASRFLMIILHRILCLRPTLWTISKHNSRNPPDLLPFCIFFYHNPFQCFSQRPIALFAATVKLQSNLPPRASTTAQKLSPDPHTLLEPLPSLSPPYLHFTLSFMKRSKKEREWYFLCFLMIIQHKITVGKTSLPKRSVVHNIIDHSPWLSSKSEFTSESIQRYTE